MRGRPFGRLSVGTRSACCRPDSSQLLMGHTEQPVSAIVPNLVLVQVHGQLQELLLGSLRSRNVAILDPSRSSHQIHVGDGSQRSAASGSLRSSSLVLALRALRRRSPSPSMTKFSNSYRSSFRTVRASKSSAPPTGRATSYPPYCEE